MDRKAAAVPNAEGSPPRRSPIRLFGLSEITALGLIAAGFLVFHILAGMLLPAAAGGSVTPREETSTSFTD